MFERDFDLYSLGRCQGSLPDRWGPISRYRLGWLSGFDGWRQLFRSELIMLREGCSMLFVCNSHRCTGISENHCRRRSGASWSCWGRAAVCCSCGTQRKQELGLIPDVQCTLFLWRDHHAFLAKPYWTARTEPTQKWLELNWTCQNNSFD